MTMKKRRFELQLVLNGDDNPVFKEGFGAGVLATMQIEVEVDTDEQFDSIKTALAILEAQSRLVDEMVSVEVIEIEVPEGDEL